MRGVRAEGGAGRAALGIVLMFRHLQLPVRRAARPRRRSRPQRVRRGEPCHERCAAYLAATALSEEHQRRSGRARAVGLGGRAVTVGWIISVIAAGACLVAFTACVVAYYLASSV